MSTVVLLSHTPQPDKTIACAAKLCYSNSNIDTLMSGLDDEKCASFVDMLANIGHESPIEHASFTFGIEGVSRALLAQITRHRIASFSVQSQRYVDLKSFEYVIPPAIEENAEAKEMFTSAMQEDTKNYIRLTEILTNKNLEELAAQGITGREAERMAEKKALEDARFVLPNACTTKMVVTMNARSLYNFFAHRCCNRAQWEIRDVANQMLKLVCEVSPNLFKRCGPPCLNGKCPEGKMSCGKQQEVKEYYKELFGKE